MNSTGTDAPTPSVPLPEGVRLGETHGVPALLVTTPAATAELLLDGAQLISWIPTGEQDLLWLSPDSAFGEREAVRGGIPLIGPWFGPGRDMAMEVKHGWLRNLRWDLAAAERAGDEVVITLATPEDVRALSATARFRLGAELSVDLTITAGPRPLELEAALHTYLAVGDVRRIEIHGLEGAAFLDNTRGLVSDVMPEGEPLRPTASTDRVVDSAAEVTVHDTKNARRIVSTPRGTAKTVVWNPWDAQVTEMADIPDAAWSDFVCIEPAIAKDGYVALAPGDSHRIGVTYRIER
ncbi:D-hexose-6-phosphate mutarotase [Brachybacterium vulturis]|uniref:Putative glucose-6-phosphate 1-epimerase n=1 Tax=Brachybacterium vulturis TaxID=2017484 RepID=A0A291GQF8_9MICO|nr:D-hexose-6-phosphate mutarotase [Brachybacterium vulturis]ATG52226.1 D-hexose-6-phosphate mutarotase [Brachybacterium vulturis]